MRCSAQTFGHIFTHIFAHISDRFPARYAPYVRTQTMMWQHTRCVHISEITDIRKLVLHAIGLHRCDSQLARQANGSAGSGALWILVVVGQYRTATEASMLSARSVARERLGAETPSQNLKSNDV